MATVTQTTPVTETPPVARQGTPPGVASARNVSVDAYRGLVMLLMMAEVLQLSRVSAAYPNSLFWKVLAFNQTHTEWLGCSMYDTIQSVFSFIIVIALMYSISSCI